VISENKEMVKVARSTHGNAAVVIRKRESGNVQIFVSKKLGIKLFAVAALIRTEELRMKGLPDTYSWEEKQQDGNMPGAEEWYYQIEAEALMNGSETKPNVPPTKIPLEKIKELVRRGLEVPWRELQAQLVIT